MPLPKVIVLTVPDAISEEADLAFWLEKVKESLYHPEMADSARLLDLEAMRRDEGEYGRSHYCSPDCCGCEVVFAYNAALRDIAGAEE